MIRLQYALKQLQYKVDNNLAHIADTVRTLLFTPFRLYCPLFSLYYDIPNTLEKIEEVDTTSIETYI